MHFSLGDGESSFSSIHAGAGHTSAAIMCIEAQKSGYALSQRLALLDQEQRHLRVLVTIVFFVSLLCSKAFGIDTDRSIKQLYHTSWTAKDGAPTQITGITRTSDGYLWIASHLGLFRFDGLRFDPYIPPPGISFPSYSILNVYGTQDGGLWVSFMPSGAAYIKNGVVKLFDQPGLELHSFYEDADGRVWATTITSLRYFDGTTWKTVSDPALAGRRVWMLFLDRSGGLWIATDKGINFIPRHGNLSQQVTQSGNIKKIGQARNGEMWMADWEGLIRPIFASSSTVPSSFPKLRIKSANFFFDRDGSLWITTSGKGVGRLRCPHGDSVPSHGISDAGIEWFTAKDGLTDDMVHSLIEDQEGDIWITTFRGLDKWRHSAFAPVNTTRPTNQFTLQTAENGDVWFGSALKSLSPISLLRGGNISSEGPRAEVASVCRDARGIIWWGGHGGIWRQQGKKFSFFPRPRELPFDWIWEVVPANETGGLWVGVGDHGLMLFKDGIWSDPQTPLDLPHITPDATFHEDDRTTWFGYSRNHVVQLSNSKVKSYTSADGLNIGRIRTIRGTKGLIWFGGETGLQVFKDGRFATVHIIGPVPLGKITGIVAASDGSLWLNEMHAVLRISPADVERISRDPNQPVSPRRFDSLDGLPGAAQIEFRSSTMVEASDHRIWVATDGGLAWIDPSREQTNPFVPQVFITGVHTDTADYADPTNVKLPAGTTTVRFNYEALSLSEPERVRFKYTLNGVDEDWHDADARLDATYNNLPPGHYEFRVAASNSDGIWNPAHASVQVSIDRLFYQTLWFRTLAVLMCAMLVWMLFLVRLRQSNEQVEVRLGERLLERERIARELHDTLLQGFQMLLLRFQVTTDTLPPDTEARRHLEDSLSRAEIILQEGRDKVSTLRSEIDSGKDLASELAEFGRDVSTSSQTAFLLTVEGNPRTIHPVVYEEVRMIAREAISNSFRHANATRIECVMQFSPRHFSFVCRDNGRGIPDSVLAAKSKNGHWGLVGMEERARKIGTTLNISRGEINGTEVDLTLRAGIAYAANARVSLLRLLRQQREKSV